jgi:hypothetical protein
MIRFSGSQVKRVLAARAKKWLGQSILECSRVLNEKWQGVGEVNWRGISILTKVTVGCGVAVELHGMEWRVPGRAF